MNLDLLDTNFSRLSHGDIVVKGHVVADKLEVYPDFPPFPPWVHDPPRLRAVAEEVRVTVDAAKGGGKVQMQARNEARQKLNLALTILAQHVVMISLYRNDPNLLHNCGFDVKGPRTFSKAANPLPPTAPQRFVVSHGPVSTSALVLVSPIPPKTGLELMVTAGDPADESSWTGRGMLFLSRNQVGGFEVAKRHFFRGRYHSANGVGPWSPTVSLIMI
jgi:hypothetical protein